MQYPPWVPPTEAQLSQRILTLLTASFRQEFYSSPTISDWCTSISCSLWNGHICLMLCVFLVVDIKLTATHWPGRCSCHWAVSLALDALFLFYSSNHLLSISVHSCMPSTVPDSRKVTMNKVGKVIVSIHSDFASLFEYYNIWGKPWRNGCY